MQIPLSQAEIGGFLGVSPGGVEELWNTEALRKSLYCYFRPIPSLMYSTIYDVLEYALTSGTLSIRLSQRRSVVWINHLAELDQDDDFVNSPIDERVSILSEDVAQYALVGSTKEREQIATIIIATQFRLFRLCSDGFDTSASTVSPDVSSLEDKFSVI